MWFTRRRTSTGHVACVIWAVTPPLPPNSQTWLSESARHSRSHENKRNETSPKNLLITTRKSIANNLDGCHVRKDTADDWRRCCCFCWFFWLLLLLTQTTKTGKNLWLAVVPSRRVGWLEVYVRQVFLGNKIPATTGCMTRMPSRHVRTFKRHQQKYQNEIHRTRWPNSKPTHQMTQERRIGNSFKSAKIVMC